MIRCRTFLLAAVASLSVFGASAYAADAGTPPMHMHKSQMNHSKPDQEVAAKYKEEATILLEKSESHRKLAQHYRGRSPLKGGANYDNVAKHCEKLAELYAQAAKEAGAVADELAK